ncbi:MAG TPA: deoxyribose-phosphate aldolase [Oculatellaceae cyanobacterium]|jgi:deoxyribose-phosphate aldolase
MQILDNQALAQAIDHTRLTFAPDENEREVIDRLCEEAKQYGFYAVCVRPQHVRQAKERLQGTSVQVATVIGFPQEKAMLEGELKRPTIGDFPTVYKMAEAERALAEGADELDWVIRVADLKADVANGSHAVYEELNTARQVFGQTPIKVIIETDLLDAAEIVAVTRWCAEVGVAMVKTSTGMITHGKGATPENILRIRQTLEEMAAETRIKASGGIKTREQALKFLELGVSRLGTSSGVQIMENRVSGLERTVY